MGSATAVQDDLPYIVDYRIELDLSWHTRHAQIRCREHADSDPCAATVISDGCGHWSIDYSAPSLDFRSLLVFDAHGLVLDYPGIAIRAA